MHDNQNSHTRHGYYVWMFHLTSKKNTYEKHH